MADTRRASLVEELVERCATLLSHDDWDRIYSALGEMHDQLREDIPDEEEFCAVFPELIAGLIARLGNQPVTLLSQAQVYANSADARHRAEAGAWIKEYYRPKPRSPA